MTITSNDEFAKRMLLLAQPAERFKPAATYDRDGDCIEFLAAPDPFYGERIDDLVTVYYSHETGQIVGSLIKGVAGFCANVLRSLPGFKIEIEDGPVKLQYIFLARLWSSSHEPRDILALTYQKLIDIADDTEVEGNLCLAS